MAAEYEKITQRPQNRRLVRLEVVERARHKYWDHKNMDIPGLTDAELSLVTMRPFAYAIRHDQRWIGRRISHIMRFLASWR